MRDEGDDWRGLMLLGIFQVMGLLFPKINDESRVLQLNEVERRLRGNKIDTAKYSIASFLPKSLLLQFTRLSNVVFLANAVLQSIPIISTISPGTAIGPLAFVLSLSMLREGYEDYKRHRKDWEINSRMTQVLRRGEFQPVQWDEVRPGEFVKIRNGEVVPADTLLLTSSSETGLCYVETANLDGESNLKEKHTLAEIANLTPAQLQTLRGTVTADNPNAQLYQFSGKLQLEGRPVIFLQFGNLLLRETVLRNTDEVVGLVIYCGHDSKILQNQGRIPHKMSGMERQVNYIQVALVVLLVLLCVGCSVGYWLVQEGSGLRGRGSYVPGSGLSASVESLLMFFTIFLLLNFLIPVTLNILIEGIKTFSALFLSFDRQLYDKKLKRHCGVLNSSIVEQLGQVDCVLTDKTGTLTANQMIFRTVALEDRVLSKTAIEQQREALLGDARFCELMVAMAVCHEVVRDHRKEEYQGSSPDEVCFVDYAHSQGFSFQGRARGWASLEVLGQRLRLEVLEVVSFSSRKRMSVVVRDPANRNRVTLFTKGADSAIFERAHWYADSEAFNRNIDAFAKEGLRTLVFAKKVLSARTMKNYLTEKDRIRFQAREHIITKEEAEEQQRMLVEGLESSLEIIGATGIEDRLQEDVPQTLSRLQQADIRVMMITGDKLETAENIGYLSHLIHQDYRVFRLSADLQDPQNFCEEVRNQTAEGLPFTLIIEGRQIAEVLEHPTSLFAELLSQAKSVIFCRSSPKEKAVIVRFVKRQLGLVVLAIGDGGNDVGMIEEASIGVGIIGKEGNSAAAVSDFSIGQFRFLDRLVLHHGRWFYWRMSYFFVFFGLKNMAITVTIFLYLCDCAFSGTLVYTQLYYLLYNCFIGISMMVNSALFDQDANDDLHPALRPYLPRIYAETKRGELFSYSRYAIWSVGAMLLAAFTYYVIKLGVLGAGVLDAEGHPSDLKSAQIANGITLSLLILILNYLDTGSHTSFFTNFVLIFASLLPTAAYFIAENYLAFLGMESAYSDNFNLRFGLAIFLVVGVVWVGKIGYQCIRMDLYPNTIQLYKSAVSEDEENKEKLFARMMGGSGVQQEQRVEGRERQCYSNVINVSSDVIGHPAYRSAALKVHTTEECLHEDRP